MKKVSTALALAALFVSCAGPKPAKEITTGAWRASLQTESGKEIPFAFTVGESSPGTKSLIISNGNDGVVGDQLTFRNDSVFFKLPFDSEIAARIDGSTMKGVWTKHLADRDAVMPFTAEAGAGSLFPAAKEPAKGDVTGRWATSFMSKDKTSQAVGEFKQDGNTLSGTFLTPTGDYRFLTGVVSGDELMLSSFDGGGAYLFTAKLNGDDISEGKAFSGANGERNWTAKRDSTAKLPDAYTMTRMKEGETKLPFEFPNTDGKQISLNDDQYKGKVVILQILGSWCPNCMDETKFLTEFYPAYKEKGVEVIGLAFERTKDFERSKKAVESFKKRFNVPYEVLLTGRTPEAGDRELALPNLERIEAFPTSIVLDKQGNVRKIHTGFSGPGTGVHYEEFKKEFTVYIDGLLAEK